MRTKSLTAIFVLYNKNETKKKTFAAFVNNSHTRSCYINYRHETARWRRIPPILNFKFLFLHTREKHGRVVNYSNKTTHLETNLSAIQVLAFRIIIFSFYSPALEVGTAV